MTLVFGESGQVARELARRVPEADFVGRARLDLGDASMDGARLHDWIVARAPTAVINAAAYTAVDGAETEEALAARINGRAPAAMATACATLGIPLVHVSTDYVFDGAGDAPWRPSDAPAPRGAYGRTKQAGEDGVRAAGGTHAILRTSWVFSAHGSNFVRTMLRLSESRAALRVVDDQVGGPTPATDIATACRQIVQALKADPAKSGTYHLAGSPDVSWCAFARAIFAMTGRAVTVTGIPSEDYPTPAPRPRNSRLDCTATAAAFGIARPDWRAGLRAALAELREVSS